MTLQIKNFHFHRFQLEIQASVDRGFIKMPPLTQPLPGKYTRIPGQPETPQMCLFPFLPPSQQPLLPKF